MPSWTKTGWRGITVEPRHDRSCWAETTSGPANEDVLSCIPDNVSPPGDAGRLEFLVYASSSFRLAPSLLLGTINAEATGQTRSFPLLSSSHHRLSLLFLYPAPYREKYVARWVCCRSIELCSMETTVPKSDDGNLERIFRKTISSDDKIFYTYFLLILKFDPYEAFFYFSEFEIDQC